jgi:hypothetical protein
MISGNSITKTYIPMLEFTAEYAFQNQYELIKVTSLAIAPNRGIFK